ncbi:hypothetical protein [Stratiformator vulcanicus]|uniref:Uncharacterized protein n=1 Tax=Stratiformator vulcanicus TaxID=2527980 RepID=A0A517R1N3_9PLAN|nr:hypothetical protein [Stratiformator vulcanicus]QDT37809.1 hypothetical protein Pan189_21910 [Stratiformator vulcanicus]
MDVHRQQCQQCGSRSLQNLIVREPTKPQRVFVRCADCGAFVARYTLSNYYHHGKGIESYLRSQNVAEDSGREWLDRFRHTEESAVSGFEQVVEELGRVGKDSFAKPAEETDAIDVTNDPETVG